MSAQTTFEIAEPQDSRLSRKPERDVVFTANGSKRASEAVWRTGALLGYESMNTPPPEEYNVEFVDWPFTKLEDTDPGELFEAHKRTVAIERPKYAVAPDDDGTFPFGTVIDLADELARYAETIIVVPKEQHPSAVPARFRVGIPCQPRFGETPWMWTEYATCGEAHLLGGSPHTHVDIMKYFVPVESVDTTSPVRAAQFGSVWTSDGWKEKGGGFYWSLARSYENIRYALNPDRYVWDPRARNQAHDYEQAFRELDDTGLFDHDEHIPQPPREAYYECSTPEELAEWVLEAVR